jgi:hypothetical protein
MEKAKEIKFHEIETAKKRERKNRQTEQERLSWRKYFRFLHFFLSSLLFFAMRALLNKTST